MILQPLVENSIKHGLGRKVGAGRITLAVARGRAAHAVIEVDRRRPRHADERLDRASMHDGIGLSNVNERLRVIYGAPASCACTACRAGHVGRALEIPDLAAPRAASRRNMDDHAPSSSTTSSSRARSCASCSAQAGGVEVVGQAATASRRWR